MGDVIIKYISNNCVSFHCILVFFFEHRFRNESVIRHDEKSSIFYKTVKLLFGFFPTFDSKND